MANEPMFRIRSIVDPSSQCMDVVIATEIVYTKSENTSAVTQKWEKCGKGGTDKKTFPLKNGEIHAYICPDERPNHAAKGVRTDQGNEYKWSLVPTDGHVIIQKSIGSQVLALRYMGKEQPVQFDEFETDVKEFLWDFISISDSGSVANHPDT